MLHDNKKKKKKKMERKKRESEMLCHESFTCNSFIDFSVGSILLFSCNGFEGKKTGL